MMTMLAALSSRATALRMTSWPPSLPVELRSTPTTSTPSIVLKLEEQSDSSGQWPAAASGREVRGGEGRRGAEAVEGPSSSHHGSTVVRLLGRQEQEE